MSDEQEIIPAALREQLERDLDDESHAPQRYLERARKIGRPTDYRPEFCERALDMCARGATLAEVAEDLDVSLWTVYRWRNTIDEFSKALKMGTDACDQRVEDSLYNRAVGYTYHSVKVTKDGDQIPIEVHMPPDVGAASLWLTNRRPKAWRQTKTLEIKPADSDLDTINAILKRFEALKETTVVAEVPRGTKLLTNGSGGHK